MAQQDLLEVVNNQLINDDEEFSDGFSNGYLYYYDNNHQLPRPLTCQSVYRFLKENLVDPTQTEQWNTGFVFGWNTALAENSPDYFFTSLQPLESDHVLVMRKV